MVSNKNKGEQYFNDSSKGILKIDYDDNNFQKNSLEFFSSISGLDNYKENFFRALTSGCAINISIFGNNDLLQNQFIRHINDQCYDVFLFEASPTNGSEFMPALWRNKLAQVIIIKNIDKFRKNYLDGLGEFLNSRRISQIKKSKKIRFEMENAKLFATTKNLKKFSSSLLSRFMVYQMYD